MDDNMNISKNYFNVVYSIYAIGWTTALDKTIKNADFKAKHFPLSIVIKARKL